MEKPENLEQKPNNIEVEEDIETVLEVARSAIKVLLKNAPEEKYYELRKALISFFNNLGDHTYDVDNSGMRDITPKEVTNLANNVIEMLNDPFKIQK